MFVCVCECLSECMCLYVGLYVCVCVCVCACVCIYVSMYTSVCVCVFVYMHVEILFNAPTSGGLVSSRVRRPVKVRGSIFSFHHTRTAHAAREATSSTVHQEQHQHVLWDRWMVNFPDMSRTQNLTAWAFSMAPPFLAVSTDGSKAEHETEKKCYKTARERMRELTRASG